MPELHDAPSGATSTEEMLRWLGQVADDRALSPVASRTAIRLARAFAAGTGQTAVRLDDLARELLVGRSTALRALLALRERGHLRSSTGGPGRLLVYRPIIGAEGGR